jgi:hypothetical protein
MGGRQDPQTYRCHKTHFGKFDDENRRIIVKRSRECRFESRRGAQIDFATDAYHRDPFAVSERGRDRARS